MRLVHFSKGDHVVVESKDQRARGPWRPKPSGFWVSDEDDHGWTNWCQDNQPDFLAPNAFCVELSPLAEILTLTTEQAVRDFHATYGEQSEFSYDVHWPRVAEQYQGIIITPYQWKLRLAIDVNWYYTWDCASGCIWDASAIDSVSPAAFARMDSTA